MRTEQRCVKPQCQPCYSTILSQLDLVFVNGYSSLMWKAHLRTYLANYLKKHSLHNIIQLFFLDLNIRALTSSPRPKQPNKGMVSLSSYLTSRVLFLFLLCPLFLYQISLKSGFMKDYCTLSHTLSNQHSQVDDFALWPVQCSQHSI